MPQWVVVAHIVVEAETPEQAITLAEATFATPRPAGSRVPPSDAQTARCTVSSVQQLPETPSLRRLSQAELPPA